VLSVVDATTGGVILQWLLGYNFSVAVWVGYIVLCGVAVQTGVVRVVHLHEALDKRLRQAGNITEQDIREAKIAGSVLRLRPKLMTVSVVMAGLVPILWSTGVGSHIMKPIASPIIGGMVTSTIHVLIITPVMFYIMKLRALRRGTLKLSRHDSVASRRGSLFFINGSIDRYLSQRAATGAVPSLPVAEFT
jgi:Cu(I)/Ag(I) efflux system membrane protein CusA/SilA